MIDKIAAVLRLLRPKSWLKNFIVFAALIFANRWHDPASLLSSSLIFAGFCFVASTVYIINDWVDLPRDRKHPEKANRPLAAGEISLKTALFTGIILLLLAGSCVYLIPFSTRLVVLKVYLVYFLLMSTYNLWLKNIFGLDILTVAAGYVLRALVGGWGISVPVTTWFKLSVFFLSLLLITGKRRAELNALSAARIKSFRPVLASYSKFLLDRLVSISAGAALITYSLYTIVGGGREISIRWMPYSILFVIYGLFRYFYLLYEEERGEAPEKLLLEDLPLQLTVVGWLAYILFLFAAVG